MKLSTNESTRKSNQVTIDVELLGRLILQKLDKEGVSHSFRAEWKAFSESTLSDNHASGILFKFDTLKSFFDELYTSNEYSLLLVLNMHGTIQYSASLLNEIDELESLENIDKVVFWTTETLEPHTTQVLKGHKASIIECPLPSAHDLMHKMVTHYIPIPDLSMQESLRINHVADQISTRLKKLFHLVLSEIAAPIYDEHYGKNHVATNSIMEFEERKLRQLISRMVTDGADDLAVDVGCGTGRHSFILGNSFRKVFAFDFSDHMIEVARNRKRALNNTNISFSVNDFEHETLVNEAEFYGHCDLVVASFGMGSFVEDTVRMLRRFNDWLKPGGYLFISFYNQDSLVRRLTPNWRDTSLSTNLDVNAQTLNVTLPGGQNFEVFCKPFTVSTEGEINKIFDITSVYSYPTFMALMPNNLLQSDLAQSLFRHVDDSLSEKEKLSGIGQAEEIYGHYVMVAARKPDIIATGFENMTAILAEKEAERYSILEHGPVLSIEDVRSELGDSVESACFVKTVVFKVTKTEDSTKRDEYVAVALPADKRVDRTKVAAKLGRAKWTVKFAPEKDLLRIGFPVGGVAPFGFNSGFDIRLMADQALKELPCEEIYTGMADNRKTLRIAKGRFLEIIGSAEWIDISTISE